MPFIYAIGVRCKKQPPLRNWGNRPRLDAWSTGAHRLAVLLRLDQGSDPVQPSATAHPPSVGIGPRSPQSHILRALRLRRQVIGTARAVANGFVVAGLLRDPFGECSTSSDGKVPGEADGVTGGETAVQQWALFRGWHPAAGLDLACLPGAERRRGWPAASAVRTW